MGLRGKNRLRLQKINIALFDSAGKSHIISNHIISEKDELTEINLSTVP